MEHFINFIICNLWMWHFHVQSLTYGGHLISSHLIHGWVWLRGFHGHDLWGGETDQSCAKALVPRHGQLVPLGCSTGKGTVKMVKTWEKVNGKWWNNTWVIVSICFLWFLDTFRVPIRRILTRSSLGNRSLWPNAEVGPLPNCKFKVGRDEVFGLHSRPSSQSGMSEHSDQCGSLPCLAIYDGLFQDICHVDSCKSWSIW